MANYYTPSGKISPLSLLYLVLACIIAYPLLGLIYAYALWYIPIIYLNFIISIGFGFGVGAIAMLITVFGKIRNKTLSAVFGVISGLTALYLHWAVWVDLVINAGKSYGTDRIGITVSNIKMIQVFALATNPGYLFELIGKINEYGTWGIRGMTVSGVFLAIIWVIEFVLVIGISAIFPMSQAIKPFCEEEGEWFSEEDLPAFNFIEDVPKMVADLENGNTNVFENVIKGDSAHENHSIYGLYSSAKGENYLSISNKRAKVDDKGKLSFDSEDVISFISISPQLVQSLKAK